MSENNTVSRITSVDTLRGLTILAMLFVNDIAGVRGAPSWMKHISPSHADGMTLADLVFPAFLFIVGMSIPLAMERRLGQGESYSRIWRHILTRTLSLLVIGVYMVNTETISDSGILNPHLWALLMYVGVILLWNTPLRMPREKPGVFLLMKIAGAALLLALALLYRGNEAQGLLQMRTQWWGILGLIGWAYLVGCASYLALKRSLPAMVGFMALLYCVFMAGEAGFFAGLSWITPWIDIGSTLGTHGAIVVSGIVLGMVLTPGSGATSHTLRIRRAVLFGLGMASAAILLHSLNDLHRMFTMNKILATAPWGLWCSAITAWTWAAVYWLMDVKGLTGWALPVKPAGSNALFAYVLAPLLYSILALLESINTGFGVYPRLANGFSTGLWRSLIFALTVTWLAGGLSRIGIRLKL